MVSQSKRRLKCLLIPFFLLLQAYSFVPDPDSKRLDYESCRVLVEQKEILSFSEIDSRIKPLGLGRVIDMMLLQSAEEYFYEIEVAGEDGVVRMFYIDARSGALKNSEHVPDKRSDSFWDMIIDSNR